jgi:hypothetical protein
MTPGRRAALLVATSRYTDTRLAALSSPEADAEQLKQVLADADIGGFEVEVSLNEEEHRVRRRIAAFFAGGRREDLLVVHFSCHGVKHDDGQLYLATTDTDLSSLDASAVSSEFVNRRMNESRSRRIVLLLDCCYSGAFAQGFGAKSDATVDVGDRFEGRGTVVLTASTSLQFAWGGSDLDERKDMSGGAAPSLFTRALVEGLRTGAADVDRDGVVSVDELYEYLYDRMRDETPHQTPQKWSYGGEGELVLARSPLGPAASAELSPELQAAVESPIAGVRAGVVEELAELLRGTDAPAAGAARRALEKLAEDDSRRVSRAARGAIGREQRRTDSTGILIPPLPPVPGARRWVVAVAAAAAVVVVLGVAGYLLARDGSDPPRGGVAGTTAATTIAAAKPGAWRRIGETETAGKAGAQAAYAAVARGRLAVAVGWSRAVGDGSPTVWRVDGERVEQRSIGSFGQMTAVHEHGGLFVAGGWRGPNDHRRAQDAQVWVSADARTWTAVCGDDACGDGAPGAGAGQGVWSVTWSDQAGWVAVGFDTREGLDGAVWRSRDGRSGWERVATDLPTFQGADGRGDQELNDVVATRGGLVAVGRDRRQGRVWTSADGIVWKRQPGQFGAGPGFVELNAVAAWPGGLVAVGYENAGGGARNEGAVWLLAPGETRWGRVEADAFAARGQELRDVAAVGGELVAVGSDTAADGVQRAASWRSADGVEWRRVAVAGEAAGASAARALAPLDGAELAVGSARPGESAADVGLWLRNADA